MPSASALQRIKTLAAPLVWSLFCVLHAGCAGNSTTVAPAAAPTTDTTSASVDSAAKTLRDRRYQQALALLERGDLAAAETALQAFASDYPDVPGAYLNLAYISHDRNQPTDAMQWVNRCIELDDSIAPAYNLRAQLKIEAGDIHGALTDYQQALALQPDYSNAHFNLALLYDIYLQDIAAAVRHYEHYLSRIPHDDERTSEWVQHLKSSLRNAQ